MKLTLALLSLILTTSLYAIEFEFTYAANDEATTKTSRFENVRTTLELVNKNTRAPEEITLKPGETFNREDPEIELNSASITCDEIDLKTGQKKQITLHKSYANWIYQKVTLNIINIKRNEESQLPFALSFNCVINNSISVSSNSLTNTM